MTTCHVFIATSLDGFIARPDGSLDWLTRFPSDGDNGYGAFMGGIDGIVMGRGTYETVLGFDPWPYDKPVVVASRTLTQDDVPTALHGKVRVTSDSPRDLVRGLQQEGWLRAYVDGGALIRSFLAEELIETMSLFRMPVLIGEGRPLFGALPRDIPLELTGVQALSNGAVRSDYRLPR